MNFYKHIQARTVCWWPWVERGRERGHPVRTKVSGFIIEFQIHKTNRPRYQCCKTIRTQSLTASVWARVRGSFPVQICPSGNFPNLAHTTPSSLPFPSLARSFPQDDSSNDVKLSMHPSLLYVCVYDCPQAEAKPESAHVLIQLSWTINN